MQGSSSPEIVGYFLALTIHHKGRVRHANVAVLQAQRLGAILERG